MRLTRVGATVRRFRGDSAVEPPLGIGSEEPTSQYAYCATMPHAIPTDCPLCHWADDPDQRLVCRNDSALFLQNSRRQGSLVGSGVIIPVRHAESVFDLTLDEVCASFQLLTDVKRWMDATYQ